MLASLIRDPHFFFKVYKAVIEVYLMLKILLYRDASDDM